MSSSPMNEMAFSAPRPLQFLPTTLRAGGASAALRSGRMDAAAVALFWILAVPSTLLALDAMSSYAQTAILIVSAAATHLYLRRGLGLVAWASIPMAALYLLHPMAVSARNDASGTATTIESWAMPLLPLLLLVGLIQNPKRRAVAALVLGGTIGALLGSAVLFPMLFGAAYLAAASRTGPLDEFDTEDRPRRSWPWRRAISALPAFSWLLGCLLAAGAFAPATADMTDGASSTPAIGPLAGLDREGALARRLVGLPKELIDGGTAWYMGISLIGLCLMSVWPRRDRPDGSRRTAALLIVLAAATWWASRGATSLHDQLVELFQYATVRRQTDASAQHVLGGMVLCLGLWMLTVGIALFQLLSGGERARFWPALLGCTAVWLLWRTAMPQVIVDLAGLGSPVLQGVGRLLVCLLLICAAAAGLERIVRKSGRRSGRFALWLLCILALSFDFRPAGAGGRGTIQPQGAPTTEIRSEGSGSKCRETVKLPLHSRTRPLLSLNPSLFVDG